MSKVIVKVLGGSLQELEASTVGEIKEKLELSSHSAAVNGEPASDDASLSDGQLITLSPSVKGGNA